MEDTTDLPVLLWEEADTVSPQTEPAAHLPCLPPEQEDTEDPREAN